MDTLISNSVSIPGTGKALVDREKLLDLVDEMRAAIPDDLQHAQEVLGSREELLAEAKEAAERMRREAEEHFRQRVSQHEVVVAARKQAEELLARGQQQAQAQVARGEEELAKRRRELEEYSLGLLRRLEANLNTQLGQIRLGIEGLLEKPRRTGIGADEEDHGR